jgi:hypothetical protein
MVTEFEDGSGSGADWAVIPGWAMNRRMKMGMSRAFMYASDGGEVRRAR